jgi:arylformamidase
VNYDGLYMLRLLDISLPVHAEMVVWPGNPVYQRIPFQSLKRGDGSNNSEIRMGTHTGTHIDAPSHSIEDGNSIDQVSLNACVGRARVVDMTHVAEAISLDDLLAMHLSPVSERLLFKTRNSKLWADQVAEFTTDYIGLSAEAARWLAHNDVKLVGVDYLSLESYSAKDRLAHRALLSKQVVIVEGLNLSGVAPGEYELCCLPLRLMGADGSPARALLRELLS